MLHLFSIALFLFFIFILHHLLTTNKILAKPPILLIPFAGFIVGICIEKQFGISLTLTRAVVVLAVILTPLIYTHIKNRIVPLLYAAFLFFCTGMYLLALQQTTYQQQQQQLPHKKTTILARVLSKTKKVDGFYNEVVRLRLVGPTTGDIFWYRRAWSKRTNKVKPTILPGDLIRIKNVTLKTAQGANSISGNPRYSDYLIKEKILASLFTRKASYAIEERPAYSFTRYVHQKRVALARALQAKMPQKTFGYFSSIFLGNKQNRAIQEATPYFKAWGIVHHLARSGLHIAIFILIWVLIFSSLPLFFLLKQGLLVLLCLTYAILSWTSISFMRSLTVFLLYELGICCNKQTNAFYLLLLTAISVLFLNPTQLFFLDFQLSFGLTLALTAVYTK